MTRCEGYVTPPGHGHTLQCDALPPNAGGLHEGILGLSNKSLLAMENSEDPISWESYKISCFHNETDSQTSNFGHLIYFTDSQLIFLLSLSFILTFPFANMEFLFQDLGRSDGGSSGRARDREEVPVSIN